MASEDSCSPSPSTQGSPVHLVNIFLHFVQSFRFLTIIVCSHPRQWYQPPIKRHLSTSKQPVPLPLRPLWILFKFVTELYLKANLLAFAKERGRLLSTKSNRTMQGF